MGLKFRGWGNPRRFFALGIAAALMAAVGCKQPQTAQAGGAAGMQMPPVPVTVGKATRRTVPNQVQAIGTVEAYSTVNVKALVDGELQAVHFTEGQIVHSGDLLFTIDPRSFEADLRQAEANLAKDEANFAQARLQENRYSQLDAAGVVSKEQSDQMKANAAALDAAVRADRAAAETARLKLSYCTVRSPITGKTGSLIVHPGNMIKSNDTALVVINQIQPLYIDFSVPEAQLDEIKRAKATHPVTLLALPGDRSAGEAAGSTSPLGSSAVQASVSEAFTKSGAAPERGTLSFVDNTVDTTTGTLRLKGTFANQGQRLWPGQFVNVLLTLNTLADAVVVPSQAVQTGQNGQFVFVVTPDNKAMPKPVSTGVSVSGVTVIRNGIQAGDTVVTDGQLRLFPGATVDIKQPAAPSQQAATGM
jgi:multidrug efflux system membrane fusion protein